MGSGAKPQGLTCGFGDLPNPQAKKSTPQELLERTVLSLSCETTSHHLRGAAIIMPYRLPKIEVKTTDKMQDITPFAGLLPVVELWNKLHLPEIIDASIGIRKCKGYRDSEQILSMVLLNLSGGSAVEHLKFLKEQLGTKSCPLPFPSPTATRDYACGFHNESEDEHRGPGRSFVPASNAALKGFEELHRHLLHCAFEASPQEELTLDQDATFIETETSGALYNYKGKRSYEALNVYCPEYDLSVATEFRDGNVNPGYGQLEQLQEVLSHLPAGVRKVKYRSDSAGYQTHLLRYLAEGRDARFGVIEFALSCPVCAEFRKAVEAVCETDWHPLGNGREWAEVVYAPNALSFSRKGPTYRFLAVRESFDLEKSVKKRRLSLELEDSRQLRIPELIEDLEGENERVKKLHLTELGGRLYKVFGIVTNIEDLDGGAIIRWHRERCGKSEEVHRILKYDLAGGHVISHRFGANAFWWNVAVLSLSLHSLLKRLLLPSEVRACRPSTLRFLFYTSVGRIVRHARRIVLRVKEGLTGSWLLGAYRRLEKLSFSLE